MDKGRKGRRNNKKLRSVTSSLEECVGKTDNHEWVVNINEFLRDNKVYRSGKSWTIYEVPESLKEVQPNAFAPKIISIGPLHYTKDNMDTMEDHKKRYLLRLLGGKIGEAKKLDHEYSPPRGRLEVLVEAMKKLELETRESYSKALHDDEQWKSSDEFVYMMVMDGCFVIELLRMYHKYRDNENATTDPIFTTPWMLTTLRRDLIMLENQLPFKVLKSLFHLTKLDNEPEPSLEALAITFFDPLLPRKDLEKVIEKIDKDDKDYQHLLDLFRFTFISTTKENFGKLPRKDIKAEQNKHCASELQDDGFLLQKTEEGELIDIKFTKGNLFWNGTLHMPKLIIDNDSVPLFLNFLAYEQSDNNAHSYFTNYFMFMDSLINTSKDVETLRECDVLYHEMGSDANVFDLIIKLCREIVDDPHRCHLSDKTEDMNAYWDYRRRCDWLLDWRKRFKKSCFWIVLSFVAAVLLLVFTGIQTFKPSIFIMNQQKGWHSVLALPN